MKSYNIGGKKFKAAACVGGVLVDPVLPENFDATPNNARPASQRKWWGLVFIATETVEHIDAYYANRTDDYAGDSIKRWVIARQKWMEIYPNGTRYDVRCLDGGAWDRSTWIGTTATLEEAIVIARGCAGSVYTDWEER